jgi:hypothetical protein
MGDGEFAPAELRPVTNATSMSVTGNVTHALLIAPADTRWMGAAAALVPPTVLPDTTAARTWYATTDADSRVAPDWLVR